MSVRCPGWGGACTNYSLGLCPTCEEARDKASPSRFSGEPPFDQPPAPVKLVNVGASTGPYWVQIGRLQTLLATQGLRITDAKDAAVLDAMAAVPQDTLERTMANTLHGPEHSRAPAAAELARRKP